MIVSFKFYVMNFVNFVIDCYSYITSHVSQAFVCDFVVVIQNYMLFDFDAKCVQCLSFKNKLIKFVFMHLKGIFKLH